MGVQSLFRWSSSRDIDASFCDEILARRAIVKWKRVKWALFSRVHSIDRLALRTKKVTIKGEIHLFPGYLNGRGDLPGRDDEWPKGP